MTDFAYIQDFVYDPSDDLINNSIFGGTITDEDDDDQFEAGNQTFSVNDYAGTMTVGSNVMAVFMRPDGSHHVYNPGPGYVTPPDPFPGAVAGPLSFCFAAGTLIATPEQETAVECLRIGDHIRTADGATVPIKWIGRQSVNARFSKANAQLVCIKAGALGAMQPKTDLKVTADHGMILDDFVINASALVNGTTIDFVPMEELESSFTVYHIETEAHDVILANGAASETFIDTAGRTAFDNHQEYLDLYGVERIIPEMDRPRISSARLVPAKIKARLCGAQVDSKRANVA